MHPYPVAHGGGGRGIVAGTKLLIRRFVASRDVGVMY